MEDLSRAELIQHCEKLQKKLNKYESRLSGKLQMSFALARIEKLIDGVENVFL